jgi:hypothetical protein
VPAFRFGRSSADGAGGKAKTKTAKTAYSALHPRGGDSNAQYGEEDEEEPVPEADGSNLMDGSEAGAIAARHVLRSSEGGKSKKQSKGRRKGGFSSLALNDADNDDDDDDLQEIELSTI